MSKEYCIKIPAHNSVYEKDYRIDNYNKRLLKVHYSEPEILNNETGILLLISGYGANAESKVYKKMRRIFSDQYNLLVLQCEYFGNEFMKVISDEEIHNIYYDSTVEKKYYGVVEGKPVYLVDQPMEESISNMNDMGIMQAVDNINAVFSIIDNVKEKGIVLNLKNTVVYGFSHGAYLAYYCNRICPNIFKLVIDNSAYVIPNYLTNPRYLNLDYVDMKIVVLFKYLISKHILLDEMYDLAKQYKDFTNQSYIVCLHGKNDKLISIIEKHEFADKINKMVFLEIGEEDLDGEVFCSSEHGLTGDFIKMFEFVYENFKNKLESGVIYPLQDRVDINFGYGKGISINYTKNYRELKIDIWK